MRNDEDMREGETPNSSLKTRSECEGGGEIQILRVNRKARLDSRDSKTSAEEPGEAEAENWAGEEHAGEGLERFRMPPDARPGMRAGADWTNLSARIEAMSGDGGWEKRKRREGGTNELSSSEREEGKGGKERTRERKENRELKRGEKRRPRSS
ncbi:hypothetical protein DFP72DRAFT_879513 [Ephemerocybe angulata]|uniref:Uncharacterized protein n=1 Tax=Ephemerocybe angulata TaxID=980116 RepID=A0A8H6MB14_9AGAR|nr:hypothetical protein DFP72DRAFT_879513 [Tulosesus angulatus]